MTFHAFILAIAYFLGAIPSGLVIGKYVYGCDLRTVGSQNIGATNAYRILGARAALAVFVCDFMKGFLATSLGASDPLWEVLCGGAALVGHIYSVFLGFKGGRGVATGFGVFCWLSWPAALASIAVWIVVLRWRRIVSLASVFGALTVPIVSWLIGDPPPYSVLGTLGAVLVVARHRENMIRLWRGEEKEITIQKR